MKKKILPMFFLLSLAIGLCIAVSGCSALKLKAPANLRVSDDGFCPGTKWTAPPPIAYL